MFWNVSLLELFEKKKFSGREERPKKGHGRRIAQSPLFIAILRPVENFIKKSRKFYAQGGNLLVKKGTYYIQGLSIPMRYSFVLICYK